MMYDAIISSETQMYALYILDTKIVMKDKWKSWLPAAFYNLEETEM